MFTSKKDELLFILDRLSEEQRAPTDAEYCRAIELLIGDDYPIGVAPDGSMIPSFDEVGND